MRQDVEAEQAILGAALQSENAHLVLLSLQETDFVVPKHRVIAATLRDMIRRRLTVDTISVAGELRARNAMDTPGGVGGSSYLHDLISFAPPTLAASYYADQVRAATRVRAAMAAAEQLSMALATEEATAELDTLLAAHRAALDSVPPTFTDTPGQEHDTVTALLNAKFGPEQWLTPGLLARAERVVITGAEGIAKTTLLRQFAVSLAGGFNPWNGARVSNGHRVLYIDAENSRQQSHNAYNWMARRIASRPLIAPGWADRIIHKTRNEGCDLPGRDAGWFHQLAAETTPDVIILGPAYKLMRGDPQKDSDVLALLQVIDEVRVKHDAAVFIETHSPHGIDGNRPVRPYGSSVWLRWPEIGFGIRQSAHVQYNAQNRPVELEIVGWRGQREYRDWPTDIQHGTSKQPPWVPKDPHWAPSVNQNYEIPGRETPIP